MRYPDGHKEGVRAGIVLKASRALRRGGLSGVSIPALMKEAGLTHGGFYGHFKNRDELVAAAVLAGAAETAERVLSEQAGSAEASVAAYLSKEHVEHPEFGCVLAALGTEGARQAPSVRRAFAESARGFVRLLERRLHKKSAPSQLSDDTLQLAARMIGAVILARLVDDDALAERILRAARAR